MRRQVSQHSEIQPTPDQDEQFGFISQQPLATPNHLDPEIQAAPEQDEQFGFISEQPSPDNEALNMLRTARSRGVYETIKTLVRLAEGQQDLRTHHFCGRVEWPCEYGTDDKVKRSKQLLQKAVKQVETVDRLDQTDFFSEMCQRYKMAQYNFKGEQGVVWNSEVGASACVLGGGLVLALVPGVGKIAGAGLVLCGGIQAGIAEAHHGNGIRVQNIELNYEEVIRLLAGEAFLEKLKAVDSNAEFKDLFEQNHIKCKDNLFIKLELGGGSRLGENARVIAGSRVFPTNADRLDANLVTPTRPTVR